MDAHTSLAAHYNISNLSIKEILAHLKGVLSFSREERQKKNALLDHILMHAPPEHIELLRVAGQQKNAPHTDHTNGQKCKHDEGSTQHRRTAQQLEDVESDEDYNSSRFLELPMVEELKSYYSQFYEATSNCALEMGTCGICTRECGVIDEDLKDMPFDKLPNSHWLRPKQSHPAHNLYDRMLLEPTAVKQVDGRSTVSVCCSCFEELKKTSDKPPRYSLANQLWIGHVPWQLQVLTFPEQLLIALLYPRVFVFKLFPK
jgi:hypothetical protein